MTLHRSSKPLQHIRHGKLLGLKRSAKKQSAAPTAALLKGSPQLLQQLFVDGVILCPRPAIPACPHGSVQHWAAIHLQRSTEISDGMFA